MPLRLRPDHGVERQDGPLQPAYEWVDDRRIGHREGQHGGPERSPGGEHGTEIGLHGRELSGPHQHVVDPAEDRHQVGLQGDGRLQLGGSDLPHPPTAYSEVGVLQWLVLGVGDELGQPIRPAPVAALLVGVLQALGAGVADGHVAVERPHDPIFTSAPKHVLAHPAPPVAPN